MKIEAVYDYIEKNQKEGKCYLNGYLFSTLMMSTMLKSYMEKPEPPKYNAGGGGSGLFSHRRDNWVYDFNCPVYKSRLEKYQIYLKEKEEMKKSDRLFVNTSQGQVEVIMSDEIFAKENNL